MNSIRRWTLSDFQELAAALSRPYHKNYYAMYSSVFGGIVTDPALMLIPIDDHIVHRGDGVFEALKCVAGKLYNLQDHLDRMVHSAAGLHLTWPVAPEELTVLILETLRAGERREALVRIYLSRGPGGFGVDPYESPAPQLYIVATALGPPFMAAHPAGARLKASQIPAKQGLFATSKNCNYLPNVLMRKEAVDAGVDFVVGFDGRGHLTEGATENFGIVTTDDRLLFPHLEAILQGTTMLRVMALAGELVTSGELRQVTFANIHRRDFIQASEVLITGTTVDVAAAVEFNGETIGAGQPGPIYRRLSALLSCDLRENTELLTPVF